ncbi:hypothetical protein V2G26_005667 [Clonostachys chloroleuca]
MSFACVFSPERPTNPTQRLGAASRSLATSADPLPPLVDFIGSCLRIAGSRKPIQPARQSEYFFKAKGASASSLCLFSGQPKAIQYTNTHHQPLCIFTQLALSWGCAAWGTLPAVPRSTYR